ncbi:16174_t:CDS:2, partial [Funneliformis geosporum]
EWIVKYEGKKVKKQTYYFPPLTKGFSERALPTGYHTSHPPNQDTFCDWEEFEDTTHKNEEDTLLDEAEEFQSISTIDE